MNKFFLLLIIFSLPLQAGPRNPFPKTPDEIWQNDRDLDQDINNALKNNFTAKTLADIQATIPDGVGVIYYCTTCTVDALCVSTGTTVGSFSRVSAKTTVCQ